MSVLQMQKISICAMKKNRKAILEELQALGVMEVNTAMTENEELQKMNTLESRQGFEKNAVLADNALDVLQEYAPEKTSMLSSLEGKKLVDKSAYRKAVDRRGDIVEIVHRILEWKKQLAEDHASIVKLENQMEALTPWMQLDVPMNTEGTEKTAVIIGSIGSQMTLDDIYSRLAESVPEIDAFDIQIVSSDTNQTCITVICLKRDSAELEKALRSIGFARPTQHVGSTPKEQTEKLGRQVDAIRQNIRETEEKIRGCADSRKQIRIVSDYFRVRAQKYEVLGTLHQSDKTFFVSGYVPARHVSALKSKLESEYDLVIDVEDIAAEEDSPILLQNGKLSGSVEGVLSAYGLPQKNEFDPSKIMSIFYIIFFGLMLSDAAYGLIVFVACAIVLKKYPRMAESMQKTIRMFMYCGVSTLVWGLLFGGFFGDAVTVISRVFFGNEVKLPALWFEPINDPMKLLIVSMAFGVIHLFTGHAIKGYICIKEKRWMDLFCDVVLWYMLLIGLILILIPSSIFASLAQTTIVFPAWINMLAKVLAIAGAAGIVLMSGRGSKNPGLRIALGAYDLYNITGWLSDVLSYSRLLALGLATGVIASVVNQMGSMMGNSIFGIIVFIIVFIGGHLFNMAINLLGAYVHTNRLQFVEFFGKFYEGGGRAFNPFKSDTKYVDVKEENSL